MRSLYGKWGLVVVLGACVLMAVMALSLMVGPESVHVQALLGNGQHARALRTLLFDVRLPRIVLGALAGGALGAVGASLQALLRNALADPYVLGTSGGAALGGTLTLMWSGMPAAGIMLPAGAFGGALGATAFVYAIARANRAASVTGVLLAGIVVNAFAAACITLIKLLATATQAQELLFWLVGTVGYESWHTLAVLACVIVLGIMSLFLMTGRMNLLSLGDHAATHLGVNLRRVQWTMFLATSLLVGVVVAFSGMIGFVGLVVPHGVRLVVGPDHRLVLPASVFAGAAFLVLADTLARLLFQTLGTEAPVGAVTAVVGCPVFLYLLLRRRTHVAL